MSRLATTTNEIVWGWGSLTTPVCMLVEQHTRARNVVTQFIRYVVVGEVWVGGELGSANDRWAGGLVAEATYTLVEHPYPT